MSEEQVTLEQELQQVFAEILEIIKVLKAKGNEYQVQEVRNKVWWAVAAGRNFISIEDMEVIWRKIYK